MEHLPFMSKWLFGLGLHGEQGGEEIHSLINIFKSRTFGLKTEGEKLCVFILMTASVCCVRCMNSGRGVNFS